MNYQNKNCLEKGILAPRGFTLIELIVALAIFSILGVAVYATLAMGIQSWRRGELQERAYQDIRIYLESLTQDLHNSLDFVDVPFQGSAESISFAVLQNQQEEDQTISHPIGIVQYHLEEKDDHSVLIRKVNEYPGKIDKKGEGIPILRNIEKIQMHYYGYPYEEEGDELSDETIQYTWFESWDSPGERPRAVQFFF